MLLSSVASRMLRGNWRVRKHRVLRMQATPGIAVIAARSERRERSSRTGCGRRAGGRGKDAPAPVDEALGFKRDGAAGCTVRLASDGTEHD